MAVQFLGTRFQSFKDDGTVNAGGSVEFYETGTATHKTTYSNSGLSVANDWPITLNSAGAADIWYSGTADVTVKDSTGTTIDTFTDINPSAATEVTTPNLVQNGSFENITSSLPDNWTQSLYTGGTGVQDADSAHGKYSWKFTSVGSGGGYIDSDSFNVTEGRPVLLWWEMKSSVVDVRNVVQVLWYDDADSLVSTTSAYDDSTTNPTSWTRKYYNAAPPATAIYAKIRLFGCHSSDATPGSTYYDGVTVLDGGFLGADLTLLGTVTLDNSIWMAEGANIASASDCNIWTTDGNTVHVTGTTTITDWGTAPQAGAWKRVIFDGALQLTHNATTNDLPNDENITTIAGDSCIVYARSTSSYQIFEYSPRVITKGVKFPATQVASTDVNTLDDYEEGTWNPGLDFGGATTGWTFTANQGVYIKIGRLVFATYNINVTAKGAAAGNARLTGLPFNCAAGSGSETLVGCACSEWSSMLTTFSFISVRTDTSSATTNAKIFGTSAAAASLTQLTDAAFQVGSILRGTFIYRSET